MVVVRRLASIVAVLWGAATIAFVAIKSIPGNPIEILSGGENIVLPAQRAAIEAQYGLNQPVIVQYFRYLGNALRGNLGRSYEFHEPVVSVIRHAAGPTIQLALSAVALAVVLAMLSALATAGRKRRLRAVAAGAELVVLSLPVYFIGIVLLAVFAFQLGWFPVTGTSGIRSLVLPAVTLSLPLAAILSQVLRDGLEAALGQPFTVTVRTRGVGETAVRVRHGIRHALLAMSTLTGTILGSVLGGSVLTETVFGRAGIGSVALNAIETRDGPVILGLIMCSALVFIVINLVVDALYLVIDPRLRTATA